VCFPGVCVMKVWKLLAGAAILAAGAAQANATITFTFEQAGQNPFVISTNNNIYSTGILNYGDFQISATALGSGSTSKPDLATQTFDISTAKAATLTVRVEQTGLNVVDPGSLLSTFTANGSGLESVLESTYVNGVELASQNFGTNNLGATFSSSNPVAGPITSTGVSYLIKTSQAGGFANSTINISSAVPEPASWATMMAGFGVLGFALRRRRNVAVSFG